MGGVIIKQELPINGQIKEKEVQLIGANGEKFGNMPIEKALELIRYKGDLSKVVYVGDSLNDVKAAVNAKIKPILLDRLDEFDEYKDRFEVIKSLDEIKR